jgi:hypothetical protein
MLSEKYRQSLDFAAGLHHGHMRKGTEIDYLSHLLSVSALVMEHGGSEDEAIAGLLHDALEDQGDGYQSRFHIDPTTGRDALKRDLALLFGTRVRDIVIACTDDEDYAPGHKSKDKSVEAWRERKERYLAKLRTASDAGILRVSSADKLHNLLSLPDDLADWRGTAAELADKCNELLAGVPSLPTTPAPPTNAWCVTTSRWVCLSPPDREGREALFGLRQVVEFLATRYLLKDGWPLAKAAEIVRATDVAGLTQLIPSDRPRTRAEEVVARYRGAHVADSATGAGSPAGSRRHRSQCLARIRGLAAAQPHRAPTRLRQAPGLAARHDPRVADEPARPTSRAAAYRSKRT